MKSVYSKRFLSTSLDETECYLYAKRNKAENDQKIREKEEQQKLEQSIHCGSKYQTSSHELYLLERQNNWALEKQSCDAARKTCMRESFSSKTCSNEGLACSVSENEPFTIEWSPENEGQCPTEGDISLNGRGQPLETELLKVSSTADTCQNLLVLNPPQVQQKNSIEQNNKRNEDNELKQNSSVTSLNRHMFQTELLRQKSVFNTKWQGYQLFQTQFLSGTSSVLSCIENGKGKFLKNVCSAEDKNYSSCNKETTAEEDNKEKDNSLYIYRTLKPFKSLQPLEIPNFLFSKISNKIKSKPSSTNFKETDWKNFEGEPSLTQSKQIHGVQKISELGKQKMQNDESNIRTSAVDSEFKERNCPPINKQEHNVLAEEVSGTYFRCNSTDTECNKIFAENDVKDKIMENSEGDDDQKSKIHIYISAENVQNDKDVSSNDLLQRRGRKSINENVGTLHMQMSIPVTTETLEKNKLNLHCSVHDSNRDICLYEAEPKLFTKEILDFQSYTTKNITFKSNCPCIVVRYFLDKKESCNVFRGKEMLKLMFSFQNMLFGWVRVWTESFHEAMPICQDDSVTPWSRCRDTLKEQCDAQELVRSTINRKHNDKIFMCLLAVVSKHLKVQLLKIMLASFFSSTNTLLATEGKSMQGEKQSLCGRKQNQLNSCTGESLRQTTVVRKENETYPGFVSSKLVESIDFELHNGCQRRCFSRTLGEAEYTFLQRGALFHNQKNRLCKRSHVRKHHLLSRVSEGFSTFLRSVSHKNSMKKQILPVKYLVLLHSSSDSSSLHKIYCCNITKVQDLIGANLRYQSYFPAHSQLKFENVHEKSTNQKISVTTLKQENKASIRLHSSFHVELFKANPFDLYENKKHKTTGYRNCIPSANEVTNEITYTMKKYLGNSSYVNADEKERANSKKVQMNCHDFLSKKTFSIFDTYEKIPLATDSEDFDQIPVVKQDSSIQEKLCEESAVIGSKEIQCLPVKRNDVLILSEKPKATTEEYNSLLLLDRHINNHENYKDLDTCSPHVANEKVDNQNTYLFSENLFPSSSNIYQSVTLPLDSSSFVNREMSEDGHCRNSSGADKEKARETIPVQYVPRGSPAITDTYLQLQAEETEQFSLQGHEQTKTGSSEPATLKQHLGYVKEQEERNYEQMHGTNESQCETVMNYLIMSYSEDKSKTFIAAEEELKMPLSIMNNGCLQDVKDKYLPLENKITQEFELKRKFDLVLEELRMFHEISKENGNNLSSLETNLPNSYLELNNAEGIDENIARMSQRKVCISSPICGTTKGKHISDINESSLHEKMLNENEDQKVSKEYSISRMSVEELLHCPAEGAAYRNPYTWEPAFLPSILFKEQSYNLQKEGGYFLSRDIIRVQPLKTCKGPIRIGLSRKARPKKLHPYLK